MYNLGSKKKLMIFLCVFLVAVVYFAFYKKTQVVDSSKISTSSVIEYLPQYNYRQTINDCAPFNAAAVVRALTKESVDSAEYAKNISWRLPNKYTLPWGLEKQLKENNIVIDVPNLGLATDEERVLFLKEKLSQKEPIIILGKTGSYQHYITIFGFDSSQDIFYVYDSMYDKESDGMTKDVNGDAPGNRNLTTEELLSFWRGGGMFGLYRWYAIVATK